MQSRMFTATILTLFPEMFPGPLGASLLGKAMQDGRWSLSTLQIRDFATDKHQTVDDTPYGGVLEADEQVGQRYNNIFGPVAAPAVAGSAHAWIQPATAAHLGVSTLPPRPRRRSRVQPVRNTRRLPDAA